MVAPFDIESDASLAARDSIAARVRAAGGSAAIAAVFLIYFGFFRLLEPGGGDLFHRASWVFYHTLRVGGVALAVIAIASLVGHPFVLLVDAMVSSVVGVLLIVTGVLMLIGGGDGLQTLISVFCGGLFLSEAARNARNFVRLRRSWGDIHETPVPPRMRAVPTAPPPSLTPATEPAGWPTSNQEPGGQKNTAITPSHPAEINSPSLETASAPPTDGFLASLSEGGPPPRP